MYAKRGGERGQTLLAICFPILVTDKTRGIKCLWSLSIPIVAGEISEPTPQQTVKSNLTTKVSLSF